MIADWEECELTGITAIDSDHRMVLAVVNELEVAIGVDSPAEVMATTFDALIRRVEDHFRREEAEFAGLAVAQLDRHGAEHRAIAARTHQIKATWLAGGVTALDNQALRRFAWAWLRHIHTADLELAAALKVNDPFTPARR